MRIEGPPGVSCHATELFPGTIHQVTTQIEEPLRVVVIGNLRVGDTLWAWKLFRDSMAYNLAVCIPYNLDAVAFLRDHVAGANVDGILCLTDPAANRPLDDIPTYQRWCQQFVPYWPGATYVPWQWDVDSTPWPEVRNLPPAAGHEPVVCQLRSNSFWKRWDPLDAVCRRLPAAVIVGDQPEGDWPHPCRGMQYSLAQLATLLQEAPGLLSIPSAVQVLAMLLGVPNVCCSPWEEAWPNEPPTTRHLLRPSEAAIWEAAQDLGILGKGS